MKLESQVCSQELSKRLKELDVKQKSLFYWDEDGHYVWRDEELQDATGKFHIDNCWSAFTVAELGEMLPSWFMYEDRDELSFRAWKNAAGEYHYIGYATRHGNIVIGGIEGTTEADARAKMLIHLIEKEIIKP